MCVSENNNHSNKDNDKTNNNYNKSQLLGTVRKGGHKHRQKLRKPILKQIIINSQLPSLLIPTITLPSFESSQKIV